MCLFASCALSCKKIREAKISFSQHPKFTKTLGANGRSRGAGDSGIATLQPELSIIGRGHEFQLNYGPEKKIKARLYFLRGREGWLTGYEAQGSYIHIYLNIHI